MSIPSSNGQPVKKAKQVKQLKPSAFSSGRPRWHYWLDAGVLFVLLGIAVLGFAPSFGGDPAYLIAGLGGIAVGLLIAAAGAHWRLGLVLMVALSFVTYMLLGSALAAPHESLLSFIPTGSSLRGLLLGIVFSWKQLLTIAAPVGVSVEVLVVPYLSALFTSVVAGTLAWRLRRPYWTMLPVLALFITSIAFGTSEAFFPVIRGALLGIGGIAWLAYRRELAQREPGAQRAAARPAEAGKPLAATANRNRRLVAGAAVVLLAGGVTVAAAPLISQADDRQVLRDAVIPPLDPHDLPSPLTDFRRYIDQDKEKVLFSVTGLPQDGRVRLAALDDYDGIVFNVDGPSSGSFAPIGDPKALGGNAGGEGTSQLSFEIQDYSGVYIPDARVARSLQYEQADGAESPLYLNTESDTAVKLDGVKTGDKYNVSVAFPNRVDPKDLAKANFGGVTMPKLENVPQLIGTKANDIAGDKATPFAKIEALVNYFRQAGKYSTGAGGSVQSLSGHGAARINKFLSGKQIVGNDEQYAVATALMANYLGIPARVVMGFYPDPKDADYGASTVEIKGSDVHAWVEVNFDGYGWVPFDPTPDKDHVPNPPDPQNASSPKPQVLQPPPPPQEQAELPPDSSPDALDNDKKKQDPWALLGQILLIIAYALIPLVILAIPFVLIALLKRRRRKKRLSQGDPAQRVGGGWNEMLSLATDLGAAVNPKQTRRETANTLVEAFPGSQSSTTALAQRADSVIFGAGQPSEQEVQSFWGIVDDSLKDMNQSVGRWHRLRAKFSPRSLLSEAGVALAIRSKSSTGKPSPVGPSPVAQGGTKKPEQQPEAGEPPSQQPGNYAEPDEQTVARPRPEDPGTQR
ncbi:hypothetical protein FHU41_002863 [Psychromicrobium silvestre]|uniref:Transglutaminase-like domain-containing protein n=1 Tax=Psychromicrobium silvestre TaxID=1645614 RepID=A0A7Y9LVY4_9MICC|nr:transglutaminaseTgpA domain-containing protein [Psychromicrobium silvestre]NYE96613.1 hypothetical protein [Psychromicrobium silvestre]